MAFFAYIYNPQIRVIVLLREPIQRALSQFGMSTRSQGPKGFAAAMHCQDFQPPPPETYASRLGSSDYIQRGFYDEQVTSLLNSSIPNHRILIVISEHVFGARNLNNTLFIYNKIFDFLEVPRLTHLNPVFERPTRNKPTFNLPTYACLRKVFRPHNERLYKILHAPIVEWECWYAKLDARLFSQYNFRNRHQRNASDALRHYHHGSPYLDAENNTVLPATCPFVR